MTWDTQMQDSSYAYVSTYLLVYTVFHFYILKYVVTLIHNSLTITSCIFEYFKI